MDTYTHIFIYIHIYIYTRACVCVCVLLLLLEQQKHEIACIPEMLLCKWLWMSNQEEPNTLLWLIKSRRKSTLQK